MKRLNRNSRASKNKRSVKTGIFILALVLILAFAVVGTVAVLYARTGSIVNIFTSGSVTCKVEETVTDGVKSSVTVKNTGNTSAYIRVMVVANTVDSSGNITGSADVSSKLCGSDWQYNSSDNCYYYKGAVKSGASTGELLKNSIDLDGLQVTILASAIQSAPDTAAKTAWGMSYANGVWSAE